MAKYRHNYPRINLSFDELDSCTIIPYNKKIYRINYNNVYFEFLINYNPNNSKAVIFGTNDFDKQKREMPYFPRNTWGEEDELETNCIWYFDPSAYLGTASLCWGYGTNSRWYLQEIATILNKLYVKLHIEPNNTIFFGSSSGGFTSMALATLMKSRAFVLNPQFNCLTFWPSLVSRFKKSCLKPGESVILERVNFVALVQSQNYCPYTEIWQNIGATNDMKTQIPILIENLQTLQIEKVFIDLKLFYNENGHEGIPSKEICIRRINSLLYDDCRIEL